MLRGNFSAKIDDKGRLKIPTLFRAAIEDRFGTQLFITSLTGELVLIYPMPVWVEVEHKLAKIPSTLPARVKYFDRVNYYGQPGEFDNQGRISIGRLSTTRDNPDRYALMIMNHILGGGAFTSRVTSRVRSDEGLAYSAGCQYSFGTYYDGTFRCFFQSRSEAVARAGAIVIEEIERMRTEQVSEEEIVTAKASFIETFSRNFASARQVAGLFANLELTDRDPDYIKSYRDNVAAVTAEDVLRVARQYLHPDKLVILAIGNVDDMLAGDSEHPDFSLTALAPGGNVTRIPLPDPMTMEYPSE